MGCFNSIQNHSAFESKTMEKELNEIIINKNAGFLDTRRELNKNRLINNNARGLLSSPRQSSGDEACEVCGYDINLEELSITIFRSKLTLDMTCENPTRILYPTGFYIGQVKDSIRWGLGKFFCNDGSFYHGMWANDMPHGLGILSFSSVNYYCGNFRNGYYYGYGEYYSNEVRCKGKWKNNFMHGEGTEIIPGFKYRGMFRAGLRHGKGKIKMESGTFEGTFKLGEISKGKFTSNNGCSCEGRWKNSKLEGESLITLTDKTSFTINTNDSFDKVTVKFSDNSELKGKLKVRQEIELIVNNTI
jgi:hypothetical protein